MCVLRMIHQSLIDCVNMEGHLHIQQLYHMSDTRPVVLSAMVRRCSQIGTLMLAFGKPAQVSGAVFVFDLESVAVYVLSAMVR